MKKIFAIFLALSMIFCLTACGNKEAYENLTGEYSDSISQRAYMEVSAEGSKGVTIKVWWGSSAFEKEFWQMEAKLSKKDGNLIYENGIHERITFSETEGEEETVETIADKLSGYFEIDEKNNSLIWSGSPEESCKDCIFIKIE